MKPQQRLGIETIPLVGEGQELATGVSYIKGGINYFVGRTIERGYYIWAQTQWRNDTGFARSHWAPSEMTDALLEPAKRFSRQRLEEISRTAKSLPAYKSLVALASARASKSAAAGPA